MRFILSLGNVFDPRTLGELACEAAHAGWDALALEDYLVYQNRTGTPTFDPWLSLAVAAMRTERLRLGTLVTPVARRHVGKLAAETVALDHLSNGRLFLGVGLGDDWDIAFRGFGEATSLKERAARVDAMLEILTGLWRGEPVTAGGLQSVQMLPKPVQRPRIPIWIGGQFPKRAPIRRAARWDGACLFIPTAYSAEKISQRDWTPEDLRALRAEITALRAPDAPPFEIAVGGRERQPDWDAERALIAASEQAGATWWQEWIAPTDVPTTRAAIKRGPLRV